MWLIFILACVQLVSCNEDFAYGLLDELINTRNDFPIHGEHEIGHISHFIHADEEQSLVKQYELHGPVSATIPLESAGRDLLVLHRADRVWDDTTFNTDNVYQKQSIGPIREGVLVQMDELGQTKNTYLTNRFYLPHGLSVDFNGNIWITDVALHQVFKFDPTMDGEPLLVLGQKFTPGNDEDHFCKPTHVAVARNGDFFVSDGYCNNRILKFDSKGHLLKQWGKRTADPTDPKLDELNVPHQLALIEERDLLCVADRENRRVVCFIAGLTDTSRDHTGEFVYQLSEEDGPPGAVYGVAFAPQLQKLFVLFNEGSIQQAGVIRSYDIESLEVAGVIHAKYDQAHTVSTCQEPTGEACLVVSDLGLSVANTTGYVWYYLMH